MAKKPAEQSAEKPAITDPTADQIADVKVPAPAPVHREHGAQVHLTGTARAAARGGLHGDIASNVLARDAAVAAGEAADGLTTDGSTPDGREQPDVIDGADQATLGEPGKGAGDPARAGKLG